MFDLGSAGASSVEKGKYQSQSEQEDYLSQRHHESHVESCNLKGKNILFRTHDLAIPFVLKAPGGRGSNSSPNGGPSSLRGSPNCASTAAIAANSASAALAARA